jgi:site-specific DNA recombinase
VEGGQVICAIYARKSTEQSGPDEAKSVTRQIAHAKAYATTKGWTVDDQHIYTDDGISGAEFSKRPALLRLLLAVAAKPRPFDVLLMSEESRLGREMVQTMQVLMTIVTSGCKVFYYLEDKERTLDSAMEKGMMAMAMFGADLEREKAHQRTRDALLGKAKAGFVPGGRCFGYRNVRTPAGVTREVNPDEALVVRRIFDLSVKGKGNERIAKVLNEERAPAPNAQQGRPNGWVASSVRTILFRPLYRGEQIWGRSKKRNAWGQKKFSRTAESTWTRVSVPALRIVDDDLWNAAHERISTSRKNYLRATDGKLWGKPASGIESKYLLTGMASCGVCGGGMLMCSRSNGRKKRSLFYRCERARVSLCSNDLMVPMDVADTAALDIIHTDVLSDQVVELAIKKLLKLFDVQPKDLDAQRKALGTQLRKVEKELANLQSAIAAGGQQLDTLLQGIADRERRVRQLKAELTAIENGPALVAASVQVRVEALKMLEDWRELLGQHVPVARQLLRKVLDRQRFVFYPQQQGDERYYEIGVTPSLERFLQSVPRLKEAVASPTGFEPVF